MSDLQEQCSKLSYENGYEAGVRDMRERAAADLGNEYEIAKEEALNDGERGEGFLAGLRYAAERLRSLPLEKDDE